MQSCMRLNPGALRQAKFDLGTTACVAEAPPAGEQLLLAILAASETMIRNRRSFWELTADFNPIGHFGAAHRS